MNEAIASMKKAIARTNKATGCRNKATARTNEATSFQNRATACCVVWVKRPFFERVIFDTDYAPLGSAGIPR